jgi:DNA replication protein DnaC
MLMPPDEQLDAIFKRLHLAYVRRHWRDVVLRAETEQWSHRDFLAVLVGEEVAHRAQTGVARRTRQAHFPFLKTVEEFDFTHQSSLRQMLMGSYFAPELPASGQNLILQGRPGRGKTHLAIAIAYKAILHGAEALFTTASALIEELCVAADRGHFQEVLKRYVAPGVLVVDEVGYLTLRDNAANVLYHVVNKRYLKRKPIIFTTNKPLTEWGRVLHDDDLAEAILDRVLHNGRLIILDGPSVRNPPTSPSPSPEDDRISGNFATELTEPTLEHGPDVGAPRWTHPDSISVAGVLAREGRGGEHVDLAVAERFGGDTQGRAGKARVLAAASDLELCADRQEVDDWALVEVVQPGEASVLVQPRCDG